MSLRKITPELVKQYAEELHAKLRQRITLKDVSTGPDNRQYLACPIGVIALHEGFTITDALTGESDVADVAQFLVEHGFMLQSQIDDNRHYCFVYGFDSRGTYMCDHRKFDGTPCYAYKLGRRIADELLSRETRLGRV